MKKIILSLIITAFVMSAHGQKDASVSGRQQHHGEIRGSDKPQVTSTKAQTDGVIMQNGKVILVKEGRRSALSGPMTMRNGSTIMSDGSIVKKDGTKMMLREGEHMDMQGNKVHRDIDAPTEIKPAKDKDKIYLVPDSAVKVD